MAKIIGRLKDVGIAKESSRGGGASATFWLPKSSITFDDRVAKARSVVNYGNIGADGNQALVASKWAEGTLDFDLLDRSFGLFLLATLGTVSTAGPTDSAYTHTFSLQNDNTHDSLAISVNEEGIGDLMYKLCMVESLSMTITPDDVVKISTNIMSKQSVGSSHSVSYTAENKFIGRHLTFKIENTTGDLAGGSNIPVRSLTINFEKNLRKDQNSGTVEPQDFLNQAFRITGEVELDYEDRTYRDLAQNGTYKAVRVQLANDQVTIGASTNPSFKLDLSRVDFEQWEQVIPNDEIASQTFNFTALYDITNGNIINDCELVNTEASY